MEFELAQPNAMPLSDELISGVLASLGEPGEPTEVAFRDQHSNDFAEIRFADGRILILKRGRYDWSAERFRTSVMASELLRIRTSLVAPRPLVIPGNLDARPLEAYWRIDLPTLQEVWPDLGPVGRARAMHSLGELLARLHSVRLPGCGPLLTARQGQHSLDEFLRADLGSRLLPAISGVWPEAVDPTEALLGTVRQCPERFRGQHGRFLHNDLHLGNVLCDRHGEEVSCVGLLDLETVLGGPPESDLANLAVHHGPLFGQPLEEERIEQLLPAYGAAVDPWRLAFFRAYHLLNMGFYSALIGHDWHAAQVAEAAHAAAALFRGSSRAAVAEAPSW